MTKKQLGTRYGDLVLSGHVSAYNQLGSSGRLLTELKNIKT